MEFRAIVEPPEPMRGLEVPTEIVAALGGGARPPVKVTINGHSWRTRVAIMRGRHLIGLSHAHRTAAGVDIGTTIDVDIELDLEPRVAEVPADLASALKADPRAGAAFDALSESRRREHVRTIEAAKRPDTRARRIETTIAILRETPQPSRRRA